MDELYLQTLRNMEVSLDGLTKRVPAPQRVQAGDSFVVRYVEKSIHQAIIQKLARMTSTLHAARILLECGFIQEQAALQRMLDEFNEDIVFLAYGVISVSMFSSWTEYLIFYSF